jgi:hypothetical protein
MSGLLKDGDPLLQENYRLLEVKNQLGLAQEGLLFRRTKGQVWGALQDEQSGYRGATDDPLLIAHEYIADRTGRGLPTLMLLGDMVKAFPRTWRAALLDELKDCMSGGAYVLTAECLDFDEVLVGMSAEDILLRATQGVPEGGVLGPLTYTKLPDVLIRRLRAAGLGIAAEVQVPVAWASVAWSAEGEPRGADVARLVELLRSGGALPDRAELEASADLQAAALAALDIVASLQGAPAATWARLPCLFHCDDPVFFAPSLGELRRCLDVIQKWARAYKQEFHVGPRKTGLLATGGVEDAAYDAAPLTLRSTPDAPPSKVILMPQKKWLGVPWSMSLDFRPFLDKQLGASRREMARLSGLSEAGALPLPLAVVAFEAKVDSQLQYARWLHVLVEGAEELLDSAFEDWARAFFKAPPYGTAALFRAELGWALTGFARSVRAAALRRAVLWRSQSLAGRTFV